jgi:hypothetical protein
MMSNPYGDDTAHLPRCGGLYKKNCGNPVAVAASQTVRMANVATAGSNPLSESDLQLPNAGTFTRNHQNLKVQMGPNAPLLGRICAISPSRGGGITSLGEHTH